MESWRGYLNEAQQLLDPPLQDDPKNIKTIGQLHDYFMSKEPGKLKQTAMKYGGITAKIFGITAGATVGAATGGAGIVAGAAAGAIAEQVIESLLLAAVTAFANIEDGTYQEGTAASYFDLDDNLTMFLRDLETKGKEIAKPAEPELQVYKEMKARIVEAIKEATDPKTTLEDLLQDITSQAVLNKRMKDGEHSGKVAVQSVD
jgi:hypothetical protein|tara:strand:+ start:65 stop:673 length:609 start_codon:yes stop_codon:yes gene_type:complete